MRVSARSLGDGAGLVVAGILGKIFGSGRTQAPVPFVHTLHPHEAITTVTVDEFDAWRTAGCDLPEDLEETRAEYFGSIKLALTAEPLYVLGSLAARGDAWTRLGVALNPHTPPVVLWGDGIRDFGLAQDPNPWVRSAVAYRNPPPPDHIRDALTP